MGYFHSASGWKRSAPAQPIYPRGAGLAAAGRAAAEGGMQDSSPSLAKSLPGREKAMAGLGNATCPWQVPIQPGTSRVLRPPQQHPQGWRMLWSHGGGGGHPRKPTAGPRAGGEAEPKGDPVQKRCPHRTGSSGKAPSRIYRKSLH